MLTCKQCASPNVFEQYQLCFKCASLHGVLTDIKGRAQTGYEPNGYAEQKKWWMKLNYAGRSPLEETYRLLSVLERAFQPKLFENLEVKQDEKDPNKFNVSYDWPLYVPKFLA